METRRLNNNSRGFSLVEMLAVVAILVILLGISMVAAAGYRDLLKITELDNAAREIYMAAENRAVLLSGVRRLSNQLGEKAPDSQFDYVSKTSMKEELLPTGSIDPALRDGDFYIVYDRKSGSVTDVFYAESSMDGLMTDGFDKFYENWAKSRSERLEMKNQMLVGWYNGQAAQGEDVELDIPEEPTIKVMIDNGEELTVTVEYTAPGPAKLSVELGNVELTDSTYDARKRDERIQNGTNGTAYTCTWVLDSLTAGKFKELGDTGVTPGENFTVTAEIAPQDGKSFAEASAYDDNNSLFQARSDGDTAYIKCLRHLQNLDSTFSGVTGKTKAEQTADIRCKDNETYGGYDFTPIYNAELSSYDGKTNKIWNLYVSGTKLTGLDAHAGLFSRTMGGTSYASMTFKNIRLVNAFVTAAKGCYAGVLVGATSDATIQNCWVYWETDETVTDLTDKDALGNARDGYHYQISGKYAGGLVGHAQGNCTIATSLAATLVSGTDCAGGLVGQFGGGTITVKYSYADCYLTGTDSKAAGLIGNLEAGRTAKLINCYAAGYIMGGKQAAGLCLGEGTTTTKNVYTVVRGIGGSDFSVLTGAASTDKFENTYFLEPKDWNDAAVSPEGTTKLTFSEMSDPSKKMMEAIAGDGSNLSFQWKTGTDGQSHPYNLRTDLDIELTVYDYPGLKGMPHYGDWTTDFKGTSLIYYERYEDGSFGVAGGNINTLKNGQTVKSDGYAIVCRADDLEEQANVSIEYAWSEDGAIKDEMKGKSSYAKDSPGFTDDKERSDYIIWKNLNEENIHLYLFVEPQNSEPEGFHPDKLSNSNVGESSFYRYLNASVKAGSDTNTVEMSTRAFYNPHFAETVVPITANYGSITTDNVKGLANTLAESLMEIKLRTPRHLYDLSQFKEYYTRRNVFHQILDLDYSAYTGYNGLLQKTEDGKPLDGRPFVQQPIGSGKTDPETGKIDAFEGTYDGDCNVIKNVVFKVDDLTGRRYAGLFGYSTGTLRNIVYEMNAEYQVVAYLGSAAENLYVGALVGGNAGTVYNCAVSGANLRAGASGVRLYVGGLVGQNQGIIRNCAAETARLSANCLNFASVYIGGLVGENAASRTITSSYAVGRIDVEVDSNVTIARICGFVGWNYGSISNSYAAVDLQSSGDKVEAYGFCGVRAGGQSGTAYLDQGNFSYRGSAYAANYSRTDDKAASTRYTDLATREKAGGMGMGTVWQGGKPDPEKEFPYPAAVKNREGQYVHYGQWPEPMPLGEMGVFYWEKLVDAEGGGNPTYHMSTLAVDPEKKTITKQSTLSEAHGDGRVVTEYGYGYYTDKNVEEDVAFKADAIGYLTYCGRVRETIDTDGKAAYANLEPNADLKKISPIEVAGSRGVAEALQEQTAEAEKYNFYCWTSFHEGGRPSAVLGNMNSDREKGTTQGLSIRDAHIEGSGTFTLTQTTGGETLSVVFGINPLFADSMSVRSDGGLTLEDEVLKGMPGKTEENPFKIRCGAQLQQINWKNGAWTDTSVGDAYYDKEYPYLSGPDGGTKKFYWKQTHDVDWVAEGNSHKWPTAGWKEGDEAQTGIFMGIAQIRVEKGSILGWFGGSYDGQNYTMKNLNVSRNSGYRPNCIGLFGYVKGATLKNIVMFSEGGSDVITVEGWESKSFGIGIAGTEHQDTAPNAWYAGGVLAGVAQGSTITNCAVAGYTIRDMTERTGCTYERVWVDYTRKWVVTSSHVGGAIGGLVGMTDSPLEGCTASATIEMACKRNRGEEEAVPTCVGGLVGSTTASVTNCYTGGEIKVTAQDASIYAGRLIGGVGMEPLGVTGNTATVKNCYSYLTLPNAGGVVKEVYNIGGTGRDNGTGTVDLGNNNYYLSGTADNVSGQRAVTYQQLAGKEEIGGQSIYALLNAGQTPAPYSPVTSEVGGLAMAGRFSYAPKDRLDLRGMDYPFPTVLTQTRVSDGMVFNVHYGEWELNGIMRPNGNRPIELDMFAWTDENGTRKDWRTHTEQLTATGSGTWGPSTETTFGDGVVKAQVVDGKLTVTALKASDTPVTVTVTFEETNGTEYSLPITVYVTARIELRPNTVSIFPNDKVLVPLTAWGRRPEEQTFDVPLTDGTLALVKAGGVSAPVSAEIDGSGVRLTRTGEETEETRQRAEVTYTYTQDGYSKENVQHQIEVDLLELPEGKWDEAGTLWTMDFGAYAPVISPPTLADSTLTGFTPGVEETVIKLTRTADAQFPPEGIKLNVTLTMEGLTHELVITVPPKPETNAVQERRERPIESAVEKMEEQPGGLYPDGAAVSAGVHDGGGVGADGGSLQRGQDQEQPGGAAEVPDPVLSPDPDL